MERATKSFEKALEANPNNSSTLRNLAQIQLESLPLLQISDTPTPERLISEPKLFWAYQKLVAAVQADKGDAVARHNLGRFLLEQIFDTNAAFEVLVASLELNPQNQDVLMKLYFILLKCNQKEAAQKVQSHRH